jgi:hypothetical protein
VQCHADCSSFLPSLHACSSASFSVQVLRLFLNMKHI